MTGPSSSSLSVEPGHCRTFRRVTSGKHTHSRIEDAEHLMQLFLSSAVPACWKLDDERMLRPVVSHDRDASVGESHPMAELVL
jgi:hypothetical protein